MKIYFDDEDLRSILNQAISTLLPHPNFNKDLFPQILKKILNIINLKEFTMEYRVLFEILVELRNLMTQFDGYSPILSREYFLGYVEESATAFCTTKSVGVEEYINKNQLNLDLRNPVDLRTAVSKLYDLCMDLYDECYSYQVPSEEFPEKYLVLVASIKNNLAVSSIRAQREIIQDRLYLGRREYRGPDDWRKFLSLTMKTMETRFNKTEEEDFLVVDSPEATRQLVEQSKSMLLPLATYGIPPLEPVDIVRHRLVVLIANENVGKTTVAINIAAQVLIAGKKVVLMTGENAYGGIHWTLLASYINILYEGELFIDPYDIAIPDNLDPDLRKIVDTVILDLETKGQIIYHRSFSADNFYEEAAELYQQVNFDALIVDHTRALVLDEDEYTSLSKFSYDAREFRKKFPVYLLVLSHPGSKAKEKIAKMERPEDSAARGTSLITQDADDVFILASNKELKEQGLVVLFNTKRRHTSVITYSIILTMHYNIGRYTYEPDMQTSAVLNSATVKEVEKDIEEQKILFGIDNDELDDEFDSGFEDLDELDDEDEDD